MAWRVITFTYYSVLMVNERIFTQKTILLLSCSSLFLTHGTQADRNTMFYKWTDMVRQLLLMDMVRQLLLNPIKRFQKVLASDLAPEGLR